MINSSFLKSIEGQITFQGIKLELLIPKDFFQSNLAEEVGTSYFLFGVVKFILYTKTDQERKDAYIGTFKYPAKFYTMPDAVTTEKLNIGDGDVPYTILVYYNNGIVMTSDEIIRDAMNLQNLVGMMYDGKLAFMEYKDIAYSIMEAKYLNSVDFGVPATYEEVSIAEYYKDPNNVVKSARYAATAAYEQNKEFYAKGITQREKVAFNSTFSGLTFEDQTLMLTMADNAKRENRKEIISDVEKVSLGLI